jgi:hypothetical protein
MFDEFVDPTKDENGSTGSKGSSNGSTGSSNGSVGFDFLLAAMKRDSNQDSPSGSSLWTEMSKKISKNNNNNNNNNPVSNNNNPATKTTSGGSNPVQRSLSVSNPNPSRFVGSSDLITQVLF